MSRYTKMLAAWFVGAALLGSGELQAAGKPPKGPGGSGSAGPKRQGNKGSKNTSKFGKHKHNGRRNLHWTQKAWIDSCSCWGYYCPDDDRWYWWSDEDQSYYALQD